MEEKNLETIFMAVLEAVAFVLLTIAAILSSRPVADVAIVCMVIGFIPPVVVAIADMLEEQEERRENV